MPLSTVINLLKFAAIMVVSLAYLYGLGWLLVGPLLNRSLISKRNDLLLIQESPLTLLAGFIINFGILLVLQTLKTSLIISAVLSLIGLSCFVVYFFRYHFRKFKNPDSTNKWIGVVFFCLLMIGPILTIALEAWDTRSIWFFHSKMIYYAGSIGLAAGWQDPSVVFSQVDYPKLIPALGAQVMYVLGFWNEYLPKLSLYLIFIPPITWLVTFARRSFSYIFLLIILPFSLYPWLWNGYMDGLLAFCFCIALLLFDRYIKSNEKVDLFSSIACGIFLLYLKNEGILAFLALLVGFVVLYLIRNRFKVNLKAVKIPWHMVVIAILALIPFALWWIDKGQWRISNDLGLGQSSSFERLTARLSDGSLQMILDKVMKYINASLNLLVVMLISNFVFRRPFIKETIPAIVATGLYVLGMVVIYLVTPHDLVWHLNNSTVRVMELANGGISVACYLILDALEHDPVVMSPKAIRQL